MRIEIVGYNPYEVGRKLVQDREVYKEVEMVKGKKGEKDFRGILNDEIRKLKGK